jgi:folate-binding protein YgfZ
LHNQTTNNIQDLEFGSGCDTIFVNSIGRNIDLSTVYLEKERILLLVNPRQSEVLINWMDRYIFPFDKVKLTDISANYAIFSLMGKESQNLLSEWVDDSILSAPEFHHQKITIGDIELILTVGCNLKIAGYNLIIPQAKASDMWQKLRQKNVLLMGSKAYEDLRILQGKPQAKSELTEEFNPLESGLWEAISFAKGCYIGQETIARLNTYQGVKQRLWGIKLNQGINPDRDKIITNLAGEKIGQLTSYTEIGFQFVGLGYIRTKAGGIGLKVRIGNAEGEVIPVPFLKHEYYQPEKQ